MIAAPSRELLETVCEAVYGHGIADAASWCRSRTCPSHRIAAHQRDNPLFRALTQSWTVKALTKALTEIITEEKKSLAKRSPTAWIEWLDNDKRTPMG